MRLDSYSADGNRFCFGRKCIIVIAEKGDAYILEFKVLNEHREKTVQETAENALKQIRTRNYEADLLAYGIPADHIYKLGFGFLGKKVWVVSDPPEKEEKDQVRSEWDNLRFR